MENSELGTRIEILPIKQPSEENVHELLRLYKFACASIKNRIESEEPEETKKRGPVSHVEQEKAFWRRYIHDHDVTVRNTLEHVLISLGQSPILKEIRENPGKPNVEDIAEPY